MRAKGWGLSWVLLSPFWVEETEILWGKKTGYGQTGRWGGEGPNACCSWGNFQLACVWWRRGGVVKNAPLLKIWEHPCLGILEAISHFIWKTELARMKPRNYFLRAQKHPGCQPPCWQCVVPGTQWVLSNQGSSAEASPAPAGWGPWSWCFTRSLSFIPQLPQIQGSNSEKRSLLPLGKIQVVGLKGKGRWILVSTYYVPGTELSPYAYCKDLIIRSTWRVNEFPFEVQRGEYFCSRAHSQRVAGMRFQPGCLTPRPEPFPLQARQELGSRTKRSS